MVKPKASLLRRRRRYRSSEIMPRHGTSSGCFLLAFVFDGDGSARYSSLYRSIRDPDLRERSSGEGNNSDCVNEHSTNLVANYQSAYEFGDLTVLRISFRQRAALRDRDLMETSHNTLSPNDVSSVMFLES